MLFHEIAGCRRVRINIKLNLLLKQLCLISCFKTCSSCDLFIFDTSPCLKMSQMVISTVKLCIFVFILLLSLNRAFLFAGNCQNCDQRGSEGCDSNGICRCKACIRTDTNTFMSTFMCSQEVEKDFAQYIVVSPQCADERRGSVLLQLQAWRLQPQPCQQRWLPGVLLHGRHSAVLQLIFVQRCCKA